MMAGAESTAGLPAIDAARFCLSSRAVLRPVRFKCLLLRTCLFGIMYTPHLNLRYRISMAGIFPNNEQVSVPTRGVTSRPERSPSSVPGEEVWRRSIDDHLMIGSAQRATADGIRVCSGVVCCCSRKLWHLVGVRAGWRYLFQPILEIRVWRRSSESSIRCCICRAAEADQLLAGFNLEPSFDDIP